MSRRLLLVAPCLAALACASEAPPPAETDEAAAPAAEPAAPAPTDRVSLAMSAAPAAIASAARIVDFDEAGNMVEVRAGTNGWMCLPDDPGTPGEDPMCLDQAWQQWLDSYVKKTPPAIASVGISYMLKGGRVPSNTDPFATEPAAGESWIEDTGHIMIVVPDVRQLEGMSTDPASGRPYVMWKGTPYAHIMVPTGTNAPH